MIFLLTTKLQNLSHSRNTVNPVHLHPCNPLTIKPIREPALYRKPRSQPLFPHLRFLVLCLLSGEFSSLPLLLHLL